MICSSTTTCTYLLHARSWQVHLPSVSAPPWESFPLKPRLGFPLYLQPPLFRLTLFMPVEIPQSPLDIYLRTYRVLPGALASHNHSAGSLSWAVQCCPLGRRFSTSGHIWASAFSQCFSFLGSLMKAVFHLVPERCNFYPWLLAPFGSSPHSSSLSTRLSATSMMSNLSFLDTESETGRLGSLSVNFPLTSQNSTRGWNLNMVSILKAEFLQKLHVGTFKPEVLFIPHTLQQRHSFAQPQPNWVAICAS